MKRTAKQTGRRPGWTLTLAMLTAPIALASCGDGQASDEQVLRVGTQRGGTRAMMEAAGELKNLSYKIEWSDFPNAQPQLEAISANAVDLGALGGPSFLFASMNNPHLRTVQALSGGHSQKVVGILVRKDAPYRSFADLRGRKVGTTRGSAGHSLILQSLRHEGMKPGDVKISFLSPNEAMAAFSSGDLDAISIWVPYLAIAVLKQDARVLTHGYGETPAYMFQVSTDTSIGKRRAEIADFSRRYARAQAWTVAHPREAGAAFARDTGLPLDVATFTMERMKWTQVPLDQQVVATLQTNVRDFGTDKPITDARIRESFDASLVYGPGNAAAK